MELVPARHFVNRMTELDFVDQRVTQLTQGAEVKDCLINIHGVPGIGKTALVAAIYEIYKDNSAVIMIALNLASIGQEAGIEDLRMAKYRFIRELLNCIPAAVAGKHEGVPLEAPALHLDDDAGLNAAITTIAQYLSALRPPLLLLLDAWDHVPEPLFSWFERIALLPLIRTTPCVCVFGSQAALRWRQFEVRRRVAPFELQALNQDATHQQIKGDRQIGEAIYNITFGHPYATEIVLDFLSQQTATSAWIQEHRSEVAQHVVDKLKERVLGKTTTELQNVFSVIALFREFDVNTLRSVVPQFVPELKNRSQSALLISIKQLLETELVRWSDETRAYQIDSTIRKIFARALQWIEPERYIAIRNAAIDYYDSLIQEVPGNRDVYLIEYCYHLLDKVEDESYNEQEFQQAFRSRIHHYYVGTGNSHLSEKTRENLRKRLVDDKELHAAFVEHHLPPELLIETLDQESSAVALST